MFFRFLFFFFKQKTAYEIMPSLVGSEMCIRDRAGAQSGVRPELVRWLETFRAHAVHAESGAPGKIPSTAAATHALAYRLGWSRFQQRHEIQLFKARLGADGEVRAIDEPWSNVE